MASYQSELGEEEGIAEELARSQRSISIAEFFEKNKHMLGFDSGARALVTAVKEGVDNSLTRKTPFVYREEGETRHDYIGDVIDRLIEENAASVIERRGGDLQQLRIDGLESLSFDSEYEVGFHRISSVFRHRVNSDIYRLDVEGGRSVELTDYHSVFVLRDGEIVSVPTSDIEEGEYVVLPDSGWGEGRVERLDLVAELLDLPPERTEDIGLYGVRDLIETHRDSIRDQVDAQYRIGDFRKCDRLPFNVLRELDLDPETYRGREIGYRFGNRIPAVLPVTDDLAELLGLYAAEGSVTGETHEKVYLSLGSHEPRLIERAEEMIDSVFGLTASTVPAHDTAVNVTINAKIVGLLLEDVFEAGTAADRKRIPRFVFDFPPSLRGRFVLGYAAGDGYPTESVIDTLCDGGGIGSIDEHRIVLSTSSDRLSSGLQYLLSSVGYDTTHERCEAETRTLNGRRVEFGESHLLYLHMDQSTVSRNRLPANEIAAEITDPKLAYNLENRQSRVRTDHALALSDGGRLTFAGDGREIAGGDLTALPVTGIERVDYEGEWVYDVSVPGDQNFMAGTSPLACHNSLDAAEEAGILPDIYVEIEESGDYYRLVVEDNGPGITKEQIPKVFGKLLYGSRFHKREQSLLPDQRVLIRRDGEVELVEIGTLCDSYLPPDGEGSLRVGGGVEAPCFDRETGEVTWQDVTHVIRHETDEPTYRIETSRGRSVEVTGNHSLFTLGEDGTPAEVAAAELSAGDHVLAPERIPAPEDVESVNLLHHVPRSELDDRDWYVYGLDQSLVEELLEEGERIRRYPTPDSDRKRTYHRLDGVEILRDSLTNNYRPKGYLPADVVVDLGWEDRVADGTIRTYQVGGDPDEVPVAVGLDEAFMRFLGLYVAEGHADARQVGFTFGSHEPELIGEVEETATAVFDAGTTTVQRERNSTRVKAFGSPLAVFLDAVCGHGAANKRVPSFVFRAPSELQQAFLDGLYDGDGSDAHPSNELELTTTSERLAREVSYLWSMRGVAASWKERTNESNINGGETDVYRVLLHGEDVDRSLAYDADTDRTARYRRLPVSLLESFRDGAVDPTTVPATRAGVFRAAGLGSADRFSDKFVFRAERLLAGESIPDDYYRRTLVEEGYVTEDGEPTGKLRRLWDLSEQLVEFGESDLCLLRVEGVERVDAPEHVYDISVPGTGADENFVAGNRGAVCVKNSRGQQGIGISAAVLYSQLTSGKPARITSKTEGKGAQYFELIVDTDTNEPEIDVERETAWERPHGTRIELEMEGNMRARQQLHDYVKYTAVVNPHARIEFHEPKESLKFERATDQLPAETEEIRPHPHGVELGTLLKMLEATDSYSLSGFLQGEFTRVGGKTARKVIDRFRDRHFGREMAWRAPDARRREAVVEAIEDAVSNKGVDATAAFAERVLEGTDGSDGEDGVEGLLDRDHVTYTDLETVVAAAAEATEAATDRRFGSTVRENAAVAAWSVVVEERESDLYALVDEATTRRKDDAAVEALARSLKTRFERSESGRDRFTRDTLSEWISKAAERAKEREGETFGETAREKISDAVWERARSVEEDPPKVREVAGTRDTAAEFLEAMRETDILSPPTDCLAPITSELVEAGLRKEYDADFYAASTRDAEVHGGDPFIVEAGIAYGGDLPAEGGVEILRFANRVPLVYQRGACATVDVVKRINWRNYNLDQPGGSGIPNGPAVLMIHVASTNVPFTSESKDAVANVPEIEDEVELALREAARELKSFLNRKRSLEQRRRKQNVIAELLPEMARKVSEVTGREPLNVEDSLARIMNNVLVERRRENGTVKLVVSNHDDTNATLDVTDILSADPGDVDGARVVEMDGEWFVKWSPEVPAGEEAALEYSVPEDTAFDVTVEGIEGERVTVDA